ncbi:carbohydrate ABC transporter permease [Streptomyces caelestis]|uniref:Cellobiose transport system permease protein n=1 Tax=Streptomyces caelestis TaxID=36816 RepID=A0A7W9HD57_9ACTN|nr:sugar ABC transporter permease [Streptomyces caelestis]MBB5799779.1 cellobiose transport system permease protein [Streptomyces caelestis]GGW73109.1 cytochrome c biogenesis protein [Streptomyces caelestis]
MGLADAPRGKAVKPRGSAAKPPPDGSRPLPGWRRYWPMYTAVSPFFILFAVFGVFPVGFSVYLSFMSWDGIGETRSIGWDNYAYLVTDSDFWQSIGNTLIIWILSTVPMVFLALVIAYALHTAVRFKAFYRVAYFVPNITSIVAMTLVLGSVFSDSSGLLNSALRAINSGGVGWLSDPWAMKVSVAAITIWRWVGYNAIICLAGLQAISSDVFEAAKVDGANNRQTFFRITLPMLRPVILFVAVTSTIGGLQLFTEPQVLFPVDDNGNVGGPGGEATTIVLYLYQQAFVFNRFGYGAAVGWALFLLIAVFSVINWRLIGGRDEDAIGTGKRKGKSRAR